MKTEEQKRKNLESVKRYYRRNRTRVLVKEAIRRKRDAEKIREAQKKIRSTAEYRVKHAAQARAWRATHKEEVRKSNQQQYAKNREKQVQYSRNYRATKPAKVLETQRNYRAQHPEWGNHCGGKRRARRKDQTPDTADMALIRQIYITAARISKCTGIKFHVDHIRPLSKEGEHHENNLQVLPGAINLKKHDDLPIECLI